MSINSSGLPKGQLSLFALTLRQMKETGGYDSSRLNNVSTDNLKGILKTIYGDAADADGNGVVDFDDLPALLRNEDKNDGLWGNSWSITGSDLESLAQKADAAAKKEGA